MDTRKSLPSKINKKSTRRKLHAKILKVGLYAATAGAHGVLRWHVNIDLLARSTAAVQ